MASDLIARERRLFTAEVSDDQRVKLWPVVEEVLQPLASLKLTVVLFALAIFLIFAGTLAQAQMDISQVVAGYFRTAVAKIDLQVFFPKSFFPDLGPVGGWFYFPGGWLIGLAMAINLAAAHLLRFKVQGRGTRLAAGAAVIVLGACLVALVVMGGNDQTLEGNSEAHWDLFWLAFKLGLSGLWLAMIGLLIRMPAGRRIERALLSLASVALGGLVGWYWFGGANAAPSDSSMRILWQLGKGGLAALVLLGGCALAFKRRAGIVLLHAGIALMMANELVVATLHSEGHMALREGETTNYANDLRSVELSIVDATNPKREQDDTTVIPKSVLLDATALSQGCRRDDVPFDVELVKFVQNATAERGPPDDNPATAGLGQFYHLNEIAASTGTDADAQADQSAAYVRLVSKTTGRPLGVYLLAVALKPQTVALDGKDYDIALRFKRLYKPYSIQLTSFRKTNYTGTDTPRDYSSFVQVVDSARHVDRPARIWMNNPLRFDGDTLYQVNFQIDENGKKTSVLQVVANTGWMIPYVGCMIVVTGLLAHFLMTLSRFLAQRSDTAGRVPVAEVVPGGKASRIPAAARRPARLDSASRRIELATPLEHSPSSNFLKFNWLALATLAVFGGWLAYASLPPRADDHEMNLYEFGKLPVLHTGRVKPFDTLARMGLRALSNRETFGDLPLHPPGEVEVLDPNAGADERAKRKAAKQQPAIRWLLDTICDPQLAAQYEVFRIENLDVLDTLGLPRREGYRYALNELKQKYAVFEHQVDLAQAKPAAERGVYEKKILELRMRVETYSVITNSFAPIQIPRMDEEDKKNPRQFLAKMQEIKSLIDALKGSPSPRAAPDPAAEGGWEIYALAELGARLRQGDANSDVAALSDIFQDYHDHDAKKFNRGVADYRESLAAHPPRDYSAEKADFEAFFNRVNPFLFAMVGYVAAFVLAMLSWLGWNRLLNRASIALIGLVFIVHAAGIVSRVYLSGRPPVFTLYSSAVFIGCAGVLLGLILEYIFPIGAGNVVACVCGFGTLLVADSLSDGDTFPVVQAVLDTQFWLATHVTCVTLGYTATFVAGLLGLQYVLRGVFTPSLTPHANKELGRMIHGVICLALFFSFFGTVLGGLWADDSWGRFWGWDPKENGALIIVLWNVLVLHARWGGMVKARGMAVLAIVGNIVTAWSWFGVNELGVGLHSYGFTEGVLFALGMFVLSQLVVIAVGLIPTRVWGSTIAAAS